MVDWLEQPIAPSDLMFVRDFDWIIDHGEKPDRGVGVQKTLANLLKMKPKPHSEMKIGKKRKAAKKAKKQKSPK